MESIARQSLIVAAVLIGAGFPFLVLDLERPQMFVYVLIYFNPKSVIAWGARGISLYFFIVSAVAFMYYRAKVTGRDPAGALALLRTLLVIGVLILALFTGLYPGYVLNQGVARPLWAQPVIPILFLFSGLHMGLAVAILARLWSAGAPDFEPEPDDPLLHDHVVVRWLDGAFIVLQIVLLASYFFTCWQVAPEATARLIEGGYGLLLWVGVVLIGWILPGADMIVRGARSNLFARCMFILIGGVCLRVLVIDGGQGSAAFIGSGL